MSKMSEMAATIADLRKCAAAIGEAADWLVDQFSDSEPVTTMPEQTEPTLTLEEVDGEGLLSPLPGIGRQELVPACRGGQDEPLFP